MATRYQRGNQKLYTEEEQTTQWPRYPVLLRLTASDYPFGILWPLCCLFFFGLRLLITPLVSWPLCCLSFFGLRSDYPFESGNQKPYTEGQTTQWPQDTKGVTKSRKPKKSWPLWCRSFFGLRLLITPLVSCGHCIVCPSVYGFWLPDRQHNGHKIPKG
jgi:hypothetical protein